MNSVQIRTIFLLLTSTGIFAIPTERRFHEEKKRLISLSPEDPGTWMDQNEIVQLKKSFKHHGFMDVTSFQTKHLDVKQLKISGTGRQRFGPYSRNLTFMCFTVFQIYRRS